MNLFFLTFIVRLYSSILVKLSVDFNNTISYVMSPFQENTPERKFPFDAFLAVARVPIANVDLYLRIDMRKMKFLYLSDIN